MAKRKFVADYIDTIKAAVASGLSIRAACAANPDWPNYPSIIAYLWKYPDVRAELDAVRNPPPTGVELARLHLDDIISRIAAGASALEACRELKVSDRAFQALCREEPAVRRRYAVAQRKRGGKAVAAKPLRRWKPADFERALEFIKGYRHPGVKFNMPAHLPSYESIHLRASRNKGFGRRFQAVMLRYRIATTPLKFATTSDVASFHSDLLQNALYRAAWKRFKGRLPHERDDLIQELIVRVLAGEMTLADLGDRRHRRKLSAAALGHGAAFRSLSDRDRTVGDGLETLADTVANNTEIFHW